MECICVNKPDSALRLKLKDMHEDMVQRSRRILRSATDPVSAVLHFLKERPEGASLAGYVVDHVLYETFEDHANIPELVKILAGHVREITRQADVIDVINEHAAIAKWGNYLIKQKERIKFELQKERDIFVMNNIVGLTAVEQGVELPIEKISVQPPHLVVTVKLGVLRPKKTFAI
jgi:hypothetical protein